MKKHSSKKILSAVITISVLFSCKSPQRLYRENLLFTDSASVVTKKDIQFQEPKIQQNDLLYILVQTADARINLLFNPSQATAMQSNTASVLQGYQVGVDDSISFPVLGKVKAAGLARSELETALTNKVGEYIKEKPSVQVRYLNFKVTILGEVNRPGSFTFSTDRVTIIDALGMAGNLSVFGRRDKVWIIREV